RDVGRPKVEALADQLQAIDRTIEICTIQERFAACEQMPECDLMLSMTDSVRASLEVNEIALRENIQTIWAGVYARGVAGEVAFWRPGLPCYQCLFPTRVPEESQTASDGVCAFDTMFVDAIVGHIALGLLSAAPSRMVALMAALRYRNFVRIKIDPSYHWN